jgi:hypothetical protein
MNFGIKKKRSNLLTNNYQMNRFIAILIFLLLFSLSPAFVQTAIAQPPPPPPVDIPIDGGLGILLAAGVGYAARKIYKTRNEQSD